MRTLPTLLISAVVLVLALSTIPAGANDQQAQSSGHVQHLKSHHATAYHTGEIAPCSHPDTRHDHSHAAVHHDHDHVALNDMQRYALLNLSGAHCLIHTYGAAREWAREWELRWVDYDTGNGIIRIYHATNKHDSGLRFTSSWDSARTQYQTWKPAR